MCVCKCVQAPAGSELPLSVRPFFRLPVHSGPGSVGNPEPCPGAGSRLHLPGQEAYRGLSFHPTSLSPEHSLLRLHCTLSPPGSQPLSPDGMETTCFLLGPCSLRGLGHSGKTDNIEESEMRAAPPLPPSHENWKCPLLSRHVSSMLASYGIDPFPNV